MPAYPFGRNPYISLLVSHLGLFPGTIMSTNALTSLFSSILCMCPYQRSLISLTFSCMLFNPSSFHWLSLIFAFVPLLLLTITSVFPMLTFSPLLSQSANQATSSASSPLYLLLLPDRQQIAVHMATRI